MLAGNGDGERKFCEAWDAVMAEEDLTNLLIDCAARSYDLLSPRIPLLIGVANFRSGLSKPTFALHVPAAAIPSRSLTGCRKGTIDLGGSPARTTALVKCRVFLAHSDRSPIHPSTQPSSFCPRYCPPLHRPLPRQLFRLRDNIV